MLRLFELMYAPINLKGVTVTIQDGAPTPATFVIVFDEGNFTWEENRNLSTRKNRGKVGTANGATVIEGDEEVMQVSFQGRFDYYKAATGTSLKEILKGGGSFVSTDPDQCSLHAVDIVLENTPDCDDSETLTFRDFRYNNLSWDVDAGTVSVTGECNATEPESSNEA